jgi:hypothetical protein
LLKHGAVTRIAVRFEKEVNMTFSNVFLQPVAAPSILGLFGFAGAYEADADVPGRRPMHPIELEWAEPGVKAGQ